MNKTIIDELFEFAEELTLLIKQDWEKSKKFIKEHKHYFLWVVALFISMQFTDILSLGKSWEIYCKKHNIKSGGGNSPPPLPPPRVDRSTKPPQSSDSSSKSTDSSSKSTDSDTKSTDSNTKSDGSKDGVKGKVGKSQSKFMRNMRRNPVFGNLDKIFNMTQGMFALIIFILIVVGVLSLPVIIFIVITYCIIKNLCSRLAIL